MKLHELSKSQQRTALKHFRAAVTARIMQWKHEAAIEHLLDHDINLDMANIAAVADFPVKLTLRALREALGE